MAETRCIIYKTTGLVVSNITMNCGTDPYYHITHTLRNHKNTREQ